jgi:hypothetical protein
MLVEQHELEGAEKLSATELWKRPPIDPMEPPQFQAVSATNPASLCEGCHESEGAARSSVETALDASHIRGRVL